MILFAQPVEQYPAHLRVTNVPDVYSADPNFPASRLLTQDLTQVTRVTASDVDIKWDFGRQRKFDVVSLLGCNIGPDALWQLFTSQDGEDWTSVHASTFIPEFSGSIPSSSPDDEDTHLSRYAQPTSKSWFYSPVLLQTRYLRVYVNTFGVTGSTIGRLFVGRSFRPKVSYQYGSSISFEDTGTSDRTDRGALVTEPGRVLVGAQVKMNFLSTQEVYDHIWEFNFWRGSCREILCCLDVETVSRLSKNILYCVIAEGRTVTADQFNTWSQTWILESI